MSFRLNWLATAFNELSSVVGWMAGGAIISGVCAFGLWALATPSDAPHGGGILLQALLLFAPLIGGAVGLIGGIAATVRRARRGDAPPQAGLF